MNEFRGTVDAATLAAWGVPAGFGSDEISDRSGCDLDFWLAQFQAEADADAATQARVEAEEATVVAEEATAVAEEATAAAEHAKAEAEHAKAAVEAESVVAGARVVAAEGLTVAAELRAAAAEGLRDAAQARAAAAEVELAAVRAAAEAAAEAAVAAGSAAAVPAAAGSAGVALDGIDRVMLLRAEMSCLQGRELRELATLADGVFAELPGTATSAQRDFAYRAMVADLAVAARVSERTMGMRLVEAQRLVADFPATLQALEGGVIGVGHVRTIVECGASIGDAESRARYEELVLHRAESVPPGRLRRYALSAAARVGKVSFQDRHEAAKANRGVQVTELDNGMSQLVHTVPTVLAAGIWDRLTRQAKAIKRAGDVRSFDQIRADLACELLLCGDASGDPDAPHADGIGIQARVAIVIPALSLLASDGAGQDGAGQDGVGLEPATLAGKGPIDLGTAKKLAAHAGHLVRILTHPVTGMVLAVDTYRPSEQLRNFLHARDNRCRFPGCNRDAIRTEIDHTRDWDWGGKTEPGNLECLCKRHHMLKHQSRWTVRQTSPGVLEWTSPTGRITTDTPETYLTFSEQ